ncbi:hypothetical protein ACRAKJ_29305 [Saccharothrix sp. DSM 118769]
MRAVSSSRWARAFTGARARARVDRDRAARARQGGGPGGEDVGVG